MTNQPHPAAALLLEFNSFLGHAEDVENVIMPVDDQLNFGAGDTAILAMAHTPLEEDFVILRGVDPTKYVAENPDWSDWEERMEFSAHVLCEAFSGKDPEITVGWYHRLKIFPISQYRYRQARKWLKEGFPEEAPDWAMECFLKYSDLLAQRAPDVVPRPVTCPGCGGRDVVLHVTRTLDYATRVGVLIREGAEFFVPITNVEEQSEHVAILHCLNCHLDADLDDDEWVLPGISQ